MPAGMFQIEMDLASFAADREDGVRTETLAIAPVNLKAGLTRSTDLQVILQPRIRVETGSERASGFGDVIIRLKQNLWGNDGGRTAFALMPFVKLPTNTGGIGNDAVEFGLIAPLAVELAGGVGLGAMSELDIVRQTDGRGYAASLIHTATVGVDLTERLGVFGEAFAERTIERGAAWIVTLDAGVTYLLAENIQLDAGAYVGATRAADDLTLFVGVSTRF